jgi:hypothetical protein
LLAQPSSVRNGRSGRAEGADAHDERLLFQVDEQRSANVVVSGRNAADESSVYDFWLRDCSKRSTGIPDRIRADF